MNTSVVETYRYIVCVIVKIDIDRSRVALLPGIVSLHSALDVFKDSQYASRTFKDKMLVAKRLYAQ
eukprot:COSAG01_NODE_48167_length_383_cov_1.957746_1_plen_65_part_10